MLKPIIATTIACSVLFAASACGKSEQEAAPGNAEPAAPGAPASEGAPAAAATKAPAPAAGSPAANDKEMPPPPADAIEGNGRVINLYVDAAGNTKKVDVWGRRSFKYGPVQLAKDIEIGQASDWFGVAKNQSVVIVDAGAGADGKELGGIFGPKKGENITGIFFVGSTGSHWETAPEKRQNVPEPPPAGKALIILRAGQLRSVSEFQQALKANKLDNAFVVGDGSGSCLKQRAEDSGGKPVILGGTNPTEHIVDPGKVKVSLHGWMEKDKCGAPALHTVEVDAQADKATLVVIYTPDGGKTLASAQFPMAIGTAE